MVLSLSCVVELNEDLGCCGDPCDVVKFFLGGGRSPTRLSRVDRDGGRDGDRSETINEFPVGRCDFIRAKPEVESRPAVSLLLLLMLLELLLTQWGGSRLLRLIDLDELKPLVEMRARSCWAGSCSGGGCWGCSCCPSIRSVKMRAEREKRRVIGKRRNEGYPCSRKHQKGQGENYVLCL